MQNVFFSIIIAAFNRANCISKAINSVLAQRFKNWELIIIDDGSTDNTAAVVRQFDDPRIRYYYQINKERSAARNYGISLSIGRFICFLDSDDWYLPCHLKILYDTIIGNDFISALYYTGPLILRNNKLEKCNIVTDIYPHPICFLKDQFMLINSICVSRDILIENNFCEKFNVWEDTHLWIRILARYPFKQINEYTTVWNINEDSSVTKVFRKASYRHVLNYITCIEHLHNNYLSTIHPYFDTTDKNEYIRKKIWMFIDVALVQNQLFISFRFLLLAFKYGLISGSCRTYLGMLYSIYSKKFVRLIS